MKQRARIYYTEGQKAQMWDRWQKGESLHQIARLFDRHHSSVRGILAESGGIRPAARRCSSSPCYLPIAPPQMFIYALRSGVGRYSMVSSLWL